METFKVIVCGSRGFKNYVIMKSKLDALLVNKIDNSRVVILSGCAQGADICGENYAVESLLEVERFPAQWSKYGKSAGFRRNELMLQQADAVVAFWDGKSHGTAHMIEIASKSGKPIRVVNY